LSDEALSFWAKPAAALILLAAMIIVAVALR
jgi:hypothetical protein